jgi:hypothetical protein
MINPLPKEYFKQKGVCSHIKRVHSFLFNKNSTTNREWEAYLAIKGFTFWNYSCSLDDIKRYAIISKEYYRNLLNLNV